MTNELTSYYFNEENWDAPEIVDGDGNIIDTLNVGENMYSWFVMNGRVYIAYEQSHYGAIIAGLMQIHHLENEEQIEKKFGEQIDDICQDIRYSKQNEGEGRFWCKYNIIEYCGSNRPDISKNLTDNYVQQVCQQVGVNKNDVYVLGEHLMHTPYDYLPIVKYLNTKTLTESILRKLIRESIGEIVNGGEKFKPTVQWISENYAKANEELFDGELGDCIFKAEPIKSNTHWLGSFGMHPELNAYNGVGLKLYADRMSRRLFVQDSWGNKDYVNKENFYDLCKPTITLSTYYSGTQESLYATLVHEMCHYYTYMKGYAPKQAHGPEFRQIGNYAAYKSNGQLTVQRIASAEQMDGYDVDDEIKQRREKRAAAQKVNAHYYLIVWKSGRVGIINPTDSCLRDIIGYEQRSDSKVKEILDITDRVITNELYEKYNFTKKMRAYRFWAEKAGITQNSEIVKRIMNNSNTHKIILENE